MEGSLPTEHMETAVSDLLQTVEASPVNSPKTVGIEIECLVACCKTTNDKYELLSRPGRQAENQAELIRECLKQFFDSRPDLKQNVNSSQYVEEYSERTVTVDDSVGADKDEEFGVDGVSILLKRTADYTRNAAEIRRRHLPRDIVFLPIEIISPVLTANNEGLRIIRAIYDFLHMHSFVTTSTTGLHVHCAKQKLADPDNDDLPLYALKNLAHLALCGEYQFSCLRPFGRLDNEDYCYLNTSGFLDLDNRSAAKAYNIVDRYTAFSQLQTDLLYDKRDEQFRGKEWAINFKRLNPRGMNGTLAGTIEFRTGEATLNTERALAWIEFIIKAFAAAVDAEDAPWSFSEHYDRNVTAKQLLMDLGLECFVDRLTDFRHSWEQYVEIRDGRKERPQASTDQKGCDGGWDAGASAQDEVDTDGNAPQATTNDNIRHDDDDDGITGVSEKNDIGTGGKDVHDGFDAW